MIDEESRAWKKGFVDIVDWLQGMYTIPDDNGEISKDLNDKIPVTSIAIGKRDEWVEKMAPKVEFYMEHNLEHVYNRSYFTVSVDNAMFKFESRNWEYYREFSFEYGHYITVVYPKLIYPSQIILAQMYHYKEDLRI